MNVRAPLQGGYARVHVPSDLHPPAARRGNDPGRGGMIRVCVAGATGWTGGAVAKAVLDDPELELVGAVARRVRRPGSGRGARHRRNRTGDCPHPGCCTPGRVRCAGGLHQPRRRAVPRRCGRRAGVACVVGSSGLTEADYAEIDLRARERGVGVICGRELLGDGSNPPALRPTGSAPSGFLRGDRLHRPGTVG